MSRAARKAVRTGIPGDVAEDVLDEEDEDEGLMRDLYDQIMDPFGEEDER